MREIAVQAAPYARLECEVAGLSVALPQPGKDAEDLGVALRAKHFIGRAKGVGVGHALRCDIAPDHRFHQYGHDVAPPALKKLDTLIGRGTGKHVLTT